MLSLQQSYEVRASIIEYLKATFSFKEKEVGEAFLRFIEDEENGLFKGPYLCKRPSNPILPWRAGFPTFAVKGKI